MISVGGGLIWLGVALLLLALVTVVIATGDDIAELEAADVEGEAAAADRGAGGVDSGLKAYR